MLSGDKCPQESEQSQNADRTRSLRGRCDRSAFSPADAVGKVWRSALQAVHRHIFQDVYAWAGRSRTIRIAKQHSPFCYPEHIESELRRVFLGLKAADFLRDLDLAEFAVGVAHLAAELNAIHAFREGNGRAQMAFLALLAIHAGHPLDLEQLKADAFLAAMIESFHGDERSLIDQFRRLAE